MSAYPGAIPNFLTLQDGVDTIVAAHPNGRASEIVAIATELGTNPRGSCADVKTRLAVSLENSGALKANTVTTSQIKTTLGEVSGSGEFEITLPGGTWGYYPQIKTADGYIDVYLGLGFTSTSYVTNISFRGSGSTKYAQQRYVTASGEDHWLFLLVDKETKDIVASYSAPDHPAYGNGGNFEKIAHPFGNYNSDKYFICIADKDSIEELQKEFEKINKVTWVKYVLSKFGIPIERSLLTIVNENYKVGDEDLVYAPLHSGKFLTEDEKGKEIQVREMVNSLPDYIKVRKLIKYTD